MQWNLINSVSLDKPVFGQPCNGCGICCIAKVCELGVTLGDEQNCKALVRSTDGGFHCGMVADPYRYMDEADLSVWRDIDGLDGGAKGELALKALHAEALGAGRGCDSDDTAVAECLAEARDNEQLELVLSF